jgi:CheY-like chemotaxis protein
MPDPEPGRILVADDEPAILELLQTVFSLWGYSVEARLDGTSALDRALQGGFALLVVDYQMPGLTGLEMLRALRAKDPRTPAILMSGYFSEAIERDARSVAGLRLLPKPFTLDALRETIRQAIAPR